MEQGSTKTHANSTALFARKPDLTRLSLRVRAAIAHLRPGAGRSGHPALR